MHTGTLSFKAGVDMCSKHCLQINHSSESHHAQSHSTAMEMAKIHCYENSYYYDNSHCLFALSHMLMSNNCVHTSSRAQFTSVLCRIMACICSGRGRKSSYDAFPGCKGGTLLTCLATIVIIWCADLCAAEPYAGGLD